MSRYRFEIGQLAIQQLSQQAGISGLVGIDDNASAVVKDFLMEFFSPAKPYAYNWMVIVRTDGAIRLWLAAIAAIPDVGTMSGTAFRKRDTLGEPGDWATLAEEMFVELEKKLK